MADEAPTPKEAEREPSEELLRERDELFRVMTQQVNDFIRLHDLAGHTVGEETAVEAMKQGASDYLSKDRLGRFGQAVKHALDQQRLSQEHRQALALLHDSLERTRLILDRAYDPYIAMDVHGRIVEWNARAESVFGWQRDEVLGQRLSETIVRPCDREAHEYGLRHFAATGEGPILNRNIGMKALHRLGYELLVELTVWPITVAGVVTFSAFVRDITARAKEEAALRQREAQVRLLLDSTAEAVFGLDLDGNCTFCNRACARLLGFDTIDEVLGKKMHNLCHHTRPDGTNYPENECRIYRAFRKGEGVHVDDEVLWRSDGTSFPVEYRSFPMRRDDEVIGSVVTFLDITERNQAEDAQRQSELRFRAIFNQLQLQINRMPLAYVLLDADLRVREWNPSAEKIFGYSRDEIIGMGPPFEKTIPQTFWPQGAEFLRQIRAGDLSAHSVNDNVTKDGRTITCEWLNTPLESEDGRFSGLMCLAHDVTERKRLEEQFRQAQKMEAVGKLAGGVAHDFNNLLTIILGYSGILVESFREGDPLCELVKQIHAAGERAARLTHQLLAFSRKQVLAPVVLDLNMLLADMEKMLLRLIGEDIDLAFYPAANLWRVRVDPSQMEQVLMNLVVNSRDAMPQGGKLTIETANVGLDEAYVACHPEARLGQHVVLGVTDSGCGMDRTTLARVFEPFFSTKGDQGTGLGLATVYGIVKQSGGHVSVYSEPGRGTSFKVYLPRDTEGIIMKGLPTESAAPLRGTETVLLVEDEEGVRSLARITLQRQGYKVLEARHGGEALLLCEQHEGVIDLLATDLVMPNMSGRELAERLLPLRPALKTLYMSGYMDDAIVRHGLLNAEVPFLQKPYTPDALAREVREVLDR